MGCRTTKLCDYTNMPNVHFIAKPITSPKITVDSFDVSPSSLNLGGIASEDASMDLHDFCETCDMQKI
jgi:hypothetical protein